MSDLPLVEVIDLRMVLCAIFAKVVGTRCPEGPKLALCIPELQPV